MKKPNDQENEALGVAADRLYGIGRIHGRWPRELPDSWRNLDPIGREEVLEVVADVVCAYVNAVSKPNK